MAAILAGNGTGQNQGFGRPSLEDRVRAIPAGRPVEVSFLNGSKLRGWIGEVSAKGFVVTHEKGNRLEEAQVTFDSVKSVKGIKSVKPSHTTRNILIGVGIAMAAIGVIAGIGVAVAEK